MLKSKLNKAKVSGGAGLMKKKTSMADAMKKIEEEEKEHKSILDNMRF